jgi:predicted component of viral defense system (DUF524 family)
MEWKELSLVSGVPTGLKLWLHLGDGVEFQDDVGTGQPGCRFAELSRCRLYVVGTGDASVRIKIGGQEYPNKLQKGPQKGHWDFNFDWGNYVGLSELQVKVGDQPVLNLPVEVYSRKLSYRDDYRRLLDELADWVTALVFSVSTPTALPTAVVAPERRTLYLTYLLLRWLMAPHRLPAAFDQVRSEPHRRLVRKPRRVDFALAHHIDSRTLVDIVVSTDLERRGRVLSPTITQSLRGHAPPSLIDVRPRVDFNTPENRFVAYLLRVLGQQLNRVERAFLQDAGEHPARSSLAHLLAVDCRVNARQVSELGRAHFLENVGPMTVFPATSQVLQRRQGYRELRDAYLRLLLSPQVQWQGLETLLEIPSRDVSTLYEYWCFFALADALTRVTGASPDWPKLVREKEDLWEIQLERGAVSALRVGSVTLWYNRGFSHPKYSYSLPLRPDFTIEVEGRRWLFDAKYRLEWEDLNVALKDERPEEDERQVTFKRADLYKMHTYRDAIRDTEAVFILYPGAVFRAFNIDRRWYEDPTGLPPGFEGVGAIPLRPGQMGALEAGMHALFRSAS